MRDSSILFTVFNTVAGAGAGAAVEISPNQMRSFEGDIRIVLDATVTNSPQSGNAYRSHRGKIRYILDATQL